MNFSQLIKNLVDAVDLGKRLATTIPGMALVLGIVLLTGLSPDIFSTAKLNADVQEREKTVARLRTEVADAERRKDQATEAAALAEERLTELRLARERAVAAYRAAPGQATAAELTRAQEAYEAAFKDRVLNARVERRAADTGAAATAATLKSEETQLAALRQRVVDAGGFTTGLSSIYEAALMLMLAGFAVGMLLDPVNKALFLQYLPSLGEGRSAGIQRLTGYNVRQLAAETKVAARDPHFFIGRGLISQAEYDELVASYYRFSEITLGMVLPTVVLGIAAIRLSDLSWWWFLASIAAAWVLFRIGLKRHSEFLRRTYSLIEGRQNAVAEQRAVAEREAIAVQQAATIRELKDIVKSLGK